MIHLLHVDTFRSTEAKELMQVNVLLPFVACSFCESVVPSLKQIYCCGLGGIVKITAASVQCNSP